MSVAIEKGTSRLAHATLASADGIEFWTRPDIVEIPYSDKDIIHEVESSDRMDILAKKYYKREKLWWVIAHANNFKDLPPELIPGTRIRIPDPFLVRKYVLV
jgi:nucleoid-associated protein YgaU